MRRALNLLRSSPHYRREAFDAGLEAAGFTVVRLIDRPRPGDVLLIWNRYGPGHEMARAFELSGATVLVAENCPLGNGWRAGVWYSLARGNPAVVGGDFATGGSGRWDYWRAPLEPWHGSTGELVALGQRSIGNAATASPHGWASRVAMAHGARVREHPGVRTDGTPLREDLRNARGVLTWSSAAALQALQMGVPVWHEHPGFAGAGASCRLTHPLTTAKCDDAARLDVFRRLAWCMWELEEIARGDAVRWLLCGRVTP